MKNVALFSIISISFILFNCQDPYNLDLPTAPKTLTFNDSIVDIDTIIDIDTIPPLDTIPTDTIFPPDSLAISSTINPNDISRAYKNAEYFEKSYNELMEIASISHEEFLN